MHVFPHNHLSHGFWFIYFCFLSMFDGYTSEHEIYDGETQEGGDICIHTADSLYCTAKTNTTL